MSHALRHEPAAYGLVVAADGSVPIDALVAGLRAADLQVEAGDVRRVVRESDKQRFAIEDDRIRAQYGRSTAERIMKAAIVREPVFWHATSPDTAGRVRS